MITCGFVGDPNAVGPTAWRPRPWAPGRELVFGTKANAYVTVASFGRAEDGTFRRRNECFIAGRALMVDDVGTKVPHSTVAHVPPSAIVETSPDNFQWWYFLSEPVRDASEFDAIIRAFISGNLLGSDPGMGGVTRVGRIPGYTNGKEKYKGWRCRLTELTDRRFTAGQLQDAFRLTLNGRRNFVRTGLLPDEARERNRAFTSAYIWLAQRGLLKRDEPDLSGWTEMSCPWKGDHTAGADTGAAIREPDEANGFYGAFRCHHGHCADKGWADLTEWMAEESAEELDLIQSHGDDQMMQMLEGK
jgi:hypothetical protein